MKNIHVVNQNIYITSSEEIKEDYVIAYGVVIKVMMFDKETLYFVNGTKAKREECKKIILTTDQDLIADGVQAIDDDFLNWFVKNPSCESVEVTYENDTDLLGYDFCYYKIIIPSEEHKQKTMSKQTSVEWLQEQYYESEGKLTRKDFEQAKAMEKEQIIEAYKYGNLSDVYFKPEQYYNKTFGGEE